MRPFVRTEIPRDFDPRLVNILRGLTGYLEQVDKGFGKLQRGEVPSGGSQSLPAGISSHHLLTDLNTNDDHQYYAYLPGRSGGQTLHGTPPASLSASWTNAGNFITASSKTPASTWSAIAVDTTADAGDIVVLLIATLPFDSETDSDTTHHDTITDTQSNTWVKLKEHTYSPDTFLNGSTISVWACVVNSALVAGVDTLEVGYDASVDAMAISSHRFTGGAGTITVAAYGQKSDNLSQPTAISVSAARDNYLFVRLTSQGQGGSTVIGNYSASAGFTAFDHTDSKTTSGTGNVGSFGEYQIGLSTGASTDPSSTADGYYNSILVALTIPPASVGDLTLKSQNHSQAGTIHLHDDAVNVATAASQKLGFWGATANVQPTTAITAATFVANTSLIVDDSATFDGYTIGQVVAALRREGLLD